MNPEEFNLGFSDEEVLEMEAKGWYEALVDAHRSEPVDMPTLAVHFAIGFLLAMVDSNFENIEWQVQRICMPLAYAIHRDAINGG